MRSILKSILAAAIAVLLLGCISGCAINEATIGGHDFIDASLDNVQVGLNEYHADDGERMKVVRRKLTGAFVSDVLASKDDEASIKAVTEQFIGLLERAELAEEVEETRYRNLVNTLRAIRDVNSGLRGLNEIRLGWKTEMRQYVDQLRTQIGEAQAGANTQP